MSEIFLHISAGQGPRECEWVVWKLADTVCREAQAAGLTWASEEPVTEPTASALLRLTGDGAEAFAERWTGSIRWIGTSPFRPLHKRKNWFVAIRPVAPKSAALDLLERDIDYSTMRASGPGGQHVNTTDSAVRAVHRPSGLSVVARGERSQHANKRMARMRIAMLLEERAARQGKDVEKAKWASNHTLERGNAVLTFEGPKFRMRG